MAEQHKAKRVHWLAIEADSRNFATASTILELLHRIEALEAAQQAKPNHPAKPDSSLVERVRQSQGCGNERDVWDDLIAPGAEWLREEVQ
jgi:hypothetical protein